MSKKPVHQPWFPAPYDPDGADTMAIKAVASGTANAGQQKRALDWIINAVCATYDLSFRPGESGDRETAFAEGKRHVGLQIVKHINGPMPSKPTK